MINLKEFINNIVRIVGYTGFKEKSKDILER